MTGRAKPVSRRRGPAATRVRTWAVPAAIACATGGGWGATSAAGPAGAGASSGSPPSWASAPVAQSVDTLQDVREVTVQAGGASIRGLCTSGTIRVALLHDDGATADSWLPVLRRLEGSVGACAYDRRGSGGSEPASRERGWYELLDELRRIHAALGLQEPYVIAGHGLGGLYARVYAMDRPGDVGGLVLVDPSHEDMPRRVRAGMPRDAWTAWMRERGRPNADGVVEESVAERARRLRLPPVRVTVITAALRPVLDGWDARFVDEAARRVHGDIVSGVAMGRHIPASRSGHDVPRDEPRLVADEILRIVGALDRERGRTGSAR
jgi:pimeloyl-ACP methyl ester carboxylesterase